VVDLIVSRMKNLAEKERMSRDAIDRLVRKGLDNLRVIEPGVKVVYKNITVESTRDQEFLDVLKKNLSAEELKGWFHIFDAAPMVRPGQG
jgi:methanogenic corrinoid protein MtbC1